MTEKTSFTDKQLEALNLKVLEHMKVKPKYRRNLDYRKQKNRDWLKEYKEKLVVWNEILAKYKKEFDALRKEKSTM